MTPTIEQIKEILANVPDGATHYQSTAYLRYDGESWVWWSEEGVKWCFVKDSSLGWAQDLGGYHGSLSDLREILELRKRVDELESVLGQLNSSTNLDELRTAVDRNVALFSRTGE